MTATIELSSAKQKLQDILGESQNTYFTHLKNWFRKRISKENFDIEARKLLPKDQSHLHNEFLLAILNKCQTLSHFAPNMMTSPPPQLQAHVVQPKPEIALGNDRLKKGKIKKRSKTSKANFDQRFQPVPHVEPSDNEEDKLVEEERVLRYCYREPVLPDVSLLHGRMLVMAWEEGLESVEDQAVQMMVSAIEQQLKKLITALVLKRSGFKVKDGKFSHSTGSKRPNPWLVNSQNRSRECNVQEVAERLDTGKVGGDSDPLVPVGKPAAVADVEQQTAFEIACSAPERETEYNRRPIDLYELLELLQERKSLIPSHSVYSVNLHRIVSRLHQLGHDE